LGTVGFAAVVAVAAAAAQKRAAMGLSARHFGWTGFEVMGAMYPIGGAEWVCWEIFIFCRGKFAGRLGGEEGGLALVGRRDSVLRDSRCGSVLARFACQELRGLMRQSQKFPTAAVSRVQSSTPSVANHAPSPILTLYTPPRPDTAKMQPTRALLGMRYRKLRLTTKDINKGYYKGTRTGSMGRHTKKGGYIIEWHKVRTYVCPPLDGFKVRSTTTILCGGGSKGRETGQNGLI
jgi:large subunit ribosomal protein L41